MRREAENRGASSGGDCSLERVAIADTSETPLLGGAYSMGAPSAMWCIERALALF